MKRSDWIMLVALTLLMVVSTAARALQEQAFQWDPITCCYCTAIADYIAPVIWGYVIGTFVGLARHGVRYKRLNPAKLRILDLG